MAPPEELYGWRALPRSFPKMLAHINTSATKPFSVSQEIIPPSELAKKVQDYARKELPEQTFNHSMRVFSYGYSIITQHFPSLVNPTIFETYFLSCMMHDIGTTPKNLRETMMSFEFYGGMLAYDLIHKELGGPKEQAESVAECVIRHQDLGDTGTVQSVEAIIMLTTTFDNCGMHPQLVHKDTIENVTKAYPRKGWSGCFSKTIKEEVGLKPWAHTTHIDNFAEDVAGNKLMEPYD